MLRAIISFSRHLMIHGIKFECGECQKKFTSQKSLDVHNREKHGIIKLGNVTLDKTSLKEYLRAKTSEQKSENCFGCKECRKEFSSRALLDEHRIEDHETGEKKSSKHLPKDESSKVGDRAQTKSTN